MIDSWESFQNILNEERTKVQSRISVNKKWIQSVSSVCLSSSCMTYTPSFILRKLSLEKTPLVIEILSNLDTGWRMKRNWISLSRWSILLYIFPVKAFITKDNANNYANQHRFPFRALLTPFPVIAFINEEAVVSKLYQWRSDKFYQWNTHRFHH